MKKPLIVTLVSALLVFGAMSTYANHHESEHHESEPQEMDADANKDGKVSYDEFKAAREKHMEEHFKRRDTNSDGFIDEAERKAAKDGMKAHKGKKDKCEMHQ